jgi:hypothetical protein
VLIVAGAPGAHTRRRGDRGCPPRGGAWLRSMAASRSAGPAQCAGCPCYAGCVHEEVERCGAIVRRAGAAATARELTRHTSRVAGSYAPRYRGGGRGVASMQVIRSSIVGSRARFGMLGVAESTAVLGDASRSQLISPGRGLLLRKRGSTPMLGLDGARLQAEVSGPQETLDRRIPGGPGRDARRVGVVHCDSPSPPGQARAAAAGSGTAAARIPASRATC